MSNLTPDQEPALFGALITAVLSVIVVFLPRFGVHLSKDEYTALAAVAVAAIPIIVGLFVRSKVTPTAAAPTPTPVAPLK